MEALKVGKKLGKLQLSVTGTVSYSVCYSLQLCLCVCVTRLAVPSMSSLVCIKLCYSGAHKHSFVIITKHCVFHTGPQ